MKPKWKTVVEFIIGIAFFLIGGYVISSSVDIIPEFALHNPIAAILGFLVIVFASEIIEDKWKEL